MCPYTGEWRTSVYDKESLLPFSVIKYPHAESTVPRHQARGVFRGALIRVGLLCNFSAAFKQAVYTVTTLLLTRGHEPSSLNHVFNRYIEDRWSVADARHFKIKQWFQALLYELAHGIKHFEPHEYTGPLLPDPPRARPSMTETTPTRPPKTETIYSNLQIPAPNSRQKTKEFLCLNSLELHEVPANGDCFFECLVHAGLPGTCLALRQHVCQYIQEHPAQFAGFISEATGYYSGVGPDCQQTEPQPTMELDEGQTTSTELCQRYVDIMGKPRVYADHIAITAAAHLFQVNFHVYSPDHNSLLTTPYDHSFPNSLVLIHTDRRHYKFAQQKPAAHMTCPLGETSQAHLSSDYQKRGTTPMKKSTSRTASPAQVPSSPTAAFQALEVAAVARQIDERELRALRRSGSQSLLADPAPKTPPGSRPQTPTSTEIRLIIEDDNPGSRPQTPSIMAGYEHVAPLIGSPGKISRADTPLGSPGKLRTESLDDKRLSRKAKSDFLRSQKREEIQDRKRQTPTTALVPDVPPEVNEVQPSSPQQVTDRKADNDDEEVV